MRRFIRIDVFFVLALALATPPVRADLPAPVDKELPSALKQPPTPIYVNDLTELKPLLSEEPDLAARANELDRKLGRASKVGWGSILGGFGLLALGMLTIEEAPDSCSGTCWARTTPVTWPLIGGGLALALTGGLAAYLISPPRRAFQGLVDPWNQRHPDRPIALQELPCGDGEGQCDDKPFPLPPELVPVSVVFKLRGRQAFGGGLRFSTFAAQKLDRGVRRTKFRGRRSIYSKTLEHVFSFSLRDGKRWADARCRDWATEEGKVVWGSKAIKINSFKLNDDTETTFAPARSDGGFYCDVKHAGDTPLRIVRASEDDPGFVLLEGETELLRARPYRAAARHHYWQETSDGYRIDHRGQLVAVFDLTVSARVALSNRLSDPVRSRVALFILAIVLEADSDLARRDDDNLVLPFL